VALTGGAVAGVSTALHRPSIAKSAPASQAEHWKSFSLTGVDGGLTSVGCLNSTYCVAVDHAGDLWVTTNPTAGTSAWHLFKGQTSSGKVFPILGMAGIQVSCAVDPSRCVAVGQRGGAATVTPSLRGQLHLQTGLSVYVWGRVVATGVSCEEALCVTVGGFTGQIPGLPAVVNSGYVYTYTESADYGGSVTGTEIPNASVLTAVSCPSPSFCVATDATGDVLTSTDPGGNATAWKVTHGVVKATDRLSGLSCPSVSLCVAVTSHGEVVVSTAPAGGTRAWKLVRLHDSTMLDSVSCASSDFCVVGGPADSVFVSQDPAGGSSPWTRTRLTMPGTEAIVGLSCPSTGFCVGVDGRAGVHVYTKPDG
jgi:hypothetical protein